MNQSRSVSNISLQSAYIKGQQTNAINAIWDLNQLGQELDCKDDPPLVMALELIQNQKVNQALALLQQLINDGRKYLGQLSQFQQVTQAVQLIVSSAMSILENDPSSSLLLLLGCESMLKGLTQKQQAYLRVQILNGQGCYYRRVGQMTKALRELENALAYIKKYNLKEVAVTHLNLSVVLSLIEEHEGALENAKKAVTESHKQYQYYIKNHISINQFKFQRCVNSLAIAFYNVGVQEQYFQKYQQTLQAYASAFKVAEDNLGTSNLLTLQLKNIYEEFARQLAIAEQQKLSIQSINHKFLHKTTTLKQNFSTHRPTPNKSIRDQKKMASTVRPSSAVILQKRQNYTDIKRKDSFTIKKQCLTQKSNNTLTEENLKQENEQLLQSRTLQNSIENLQNQAQKERDQLEKIQEEKQKELQKLQAIKYLNYQIRDKPKIKLNNNREYIEKNEDHFNTQPIILDQSDQSDPQPLISINPIIQQSESIDLEHKREVSEFQIEETIQPLINKQSSHLIEQKQEFGDFEEIQEEISNDNEKNTNNNEKSINNSLHNHKNINYSQNNETQSISQQQKQKLFQEQQQQYQQQQQQQQFQQQLVQEEQLDDEQNQIILLQQQEKLIEQVDKIISQKKEELLQQKKNKAASLIQLKFQEYKKKFSYKLLGILNNYEYFIHKKDYQMTDAQQQIHKGELIIGYGQRSIEFIYFDFNVIRKSKRKPVNIQQVLNHILKFKIDAQINKKLLNDNNLQIIADQLIIKDQNLEFINNDNQYIDIEQSGYLLDMKNNKIISKEQVVQRKLKDQSPLTLADIQNDHFDNEEIQQDTQQPIHFDILNGIEQNQNDKMNSNSEESQVRSKSQSQETVDFKRSSIVRFSGIQQKGGTQKQLDNCDRLQEEGQFIENNEQNRNLQDNQFNNQLEQDYIYEESFNNETNSSKKLIIDKQKEDLEQNQNQESRINKNLDQNSIRDEVKQESKIDLQEQQLLSQQQQQQQQQNNSKQQLSQQLEENQENLKSDQELKQGQQQELMTQSNNLKSIENFRSQKSFSKEEMNNQNSKSLSNLNEESQDLKDELQDNVTLNLKQEQEVQEVQEEVKEIKEVKETSIQRLIKKIDEANLPNLMSDDDEQDPEQLLQFEQIGYIQGLNKINGQLILISIGVNREQELFQGKCIEMKLKPVCFKSENLEKTIKKPQKYLKGFVFMDHKQAQIKVYSKLHEKAIQKLQNKFKFKHYKKIFKFKLPKSNIHGELFVGHQRHTIYLAVKETESGIRQSYKFQNEDYRKFINNIQFRIINNLKYSQEQGIYLLTEPEHRILAQNLQTKILQLQKTSNKFEYVGFGLLNAIYDAVHKKIILASDNRKIEASQVDVPKQMAQEQLQDFAKSLLERSFIIQAKKESCVIYYEQKDEEIVSILQKKLFRYQTIRELEFAFNSTQNCRFQTQIIKIQLQQRLRQYYAIKINDQDPIELGKLNQEQSKKLLNNIKKLISINILIRENEIQLDTEEILNFVNDGEYNKLLRMDLKDFIHFINQVPEETKIQKSNELQSQQEQQIQNSEQKLNNSESGQGNESMYHSMQFQKVSQYN